MLADPVTKSTLGVGFAGERRRPSDPEAWKRTIGNKPVSARLALLPEGKPRWGRIGVSALAQVVLVGCVLMVPLLYPERMRTALHYDIIELARPVVEIPVAPPPPPPPKMRGTQGYAAGSRSRRACEIESQATACVRDPQGESAQN